MDIKKRIQEQLQQRDMTMAMLASKMGISAPTLSNTINCNNPKINSLKKIADTLGIAVADLLQDSEESRTAFVVCPKCGTKLSIIIQEDTEDDK